MLLPSLVGALPRWVAQNIWAMDGPVLSCCAHCLTGLSRAPLPLDSEQCGDTAEFRHRGLPLCGAEAE